MPILDTVGGQQPTEGFQGPPATVDGTPAMEVSPFRRCTGHCCLEFALGGLTMADLEENLRRSQVHKVPLSKDVGITGPWPQKCSNGSYFHGPVSDIEIVVTMLEPLLDPDNNDDRPRTWLGIERQKGVPRFCCKLMVDGCCTIYAERPHFCRSYGETSQCEWQDCTRE